jgi:nucleoside-diphosphate-sugar epimerase
MSNSKPILVLTGATGFIGKHISNYFVNIGWYVIALVRNIPNKNEENICYIKYDLVSEIDVSLPNQFDAFIHAGYLKQENGNDAFALNINAVEKLRKGLSNKQVGAKLFLSSLSADQNAASVYGRQKMAIEELFLKENGIVIRAGLVLGEGGLFGIMENYLRTKNKIPLFGSGKQPIQTVYIDDLVLAIEKIISKKLTGKLVVACNEAVTYRDFYEALAISVGSKPKFVKTPYWLAGLGILIAKFLRIQLPITKDNLLGLKQMKHISTTGDLKKIGIELIDYKESFLKLGNRRKEEKFTQ